MEDYKKLSEYDIRTTLSMSDLFPTLVDNGDGTYSNKNVPLSAIRTYSAVPAGGSTNQVLQKTSNTDYATGWHTLSKNDVGLSNVDNTSDTDKPVSTAVTAAIAAAVSATKQALYPVGSIYTNASDSTNPATLLGFGTWTAFAAGRVPVGKASSGTFATIGATGGEETHTLSVTEIPSHQHGLDNNSQTHSAGSSYSHTAGAGSWNFGTMGASATQYSGGGGAHNNLQPYIVVYMWQRTA